MAEADPTPEYRCLLCIKPYNQPRELPCNHTFCRPCLTSYIDKEHRTADEDRHYFPCPVCDAPTSPRDVSTNVNTWGTSFPINNHFITPKARTADVQDCEACLRVGESNPAVVWCTDCAEMLCKQCRRFHERIKMTAQHRLVPSKDGGFGDTTINEVCPNHEGRSLDVYCLDHSSMCCCICVSVSHKTCNHIKPIEDVIKTSTKRQPSHETTWESIRDEAKTMVEDDETEMTLLSSKEKEASGNMTHIIQQAKDKLDGLNTTFKSDLADTFNERRKQLSARMNCVKKFYTNTENSNMLMNRFERQGTDRQRFVMREKTKNQMSAHYRRMDQNTKKQPNVFDITLKINVVIDDIMKMTTVGNVDVTSKISSTSQNANTGIGTSLGTLMSTPSTTTLADSTSTSDLMGSVNKTTPGPETVDVWTGSVSCVLSVNRRALEGTKYPWLTGGMFTDNDEFLVVDLNNSRLVLLDDAYSYLREYQVDGKPTEVTRGRTTDEIFVATTEGVMRCTLQNGQLTVMETISCKRTLGIAVLGDNILVGTSRSVEVMSVDGSVKKSIQKGEGWTCLAVSTSKASCYYTDGNDIVCRRVDSDTADFYYNNPDLRIPVSIGLDRDANVYVCERDSKNLHLVSPDGSRGKVLVPRFSTITHPWCIVVHPTKQEFVVTSHGEDTSLEVYRFNDNGDVIQ